MLEGEGVTWRACARKTSVNPWPLQYSDTPAAFPCRENKCIALDGISFEPSLLLVFTNQIPKWCTMSSFYTAGCCSFTQKENINHAAKVWAPHWSICIRVNRSLCRKAHIVFLKISGQVTASSQKYKPVFFVLLSFQWHSRGNDGIENRVLISIIIRRDLFKVGGGGVSPK